MAWSKNLDWSLFYQQLDSQQAEQYLNRLGLVREPPTRAYLDQLAYAHLCAIPFESLDVTDYSLPISLLPGDLFQKIVLRRRGGYCFELNALFLLLLNALGFEAYAAPCRMLRHTEPVDVPATHCCNMVTIDGTLLFCDVGYGGLMAAGSLVFEHSGRQAVRGETYQFRRISAYWSTLSSIKPDGQEIPLLRVSPVDFLPVDFYGPNLLRSQGDSAFAARTVTLRQPNGYIALNDNTLTVKADGIRRDQELPENEIQQVLRREFHLDV